MDPRNQRQPRSLPLNQPPSVNPFKFIMLSLRTNTTTTVREPRAGVLRLAVPKQTQLSKHPIPKCSRKHIIVALASGMVCVFFYTSQSSPRHPRQKFSACSVFGIGDELELEHLIHDVVAPRGDAERSRRR